jgi:molybdopterin-guanine dinucleotide biosynthesis protein A
MGQPKVWLPCGREVLLQRMVRLVGEVVRPVVVAARRGQSLPSLPADVKVVYDVVENAGPLAGIAAGLEALADRCKAAFVCSCDHPLLRPELMRALIRRLGDAPGVVPEHEGRVCPLAAVYRVTTSQLVSDMLSRGDLRAADFAARCGATIVSSNELTDVDPNLDSLKNVNDPATYARVARAMEKDEGQNA